MPKVAIECPGCGTKLNLPDESKLGKKIKCPKCADTFVAEAAENEDEEFEDEESSKSFKSSGRRKATTAAGAGSTRRTKGGGKKDSKPKGGNTGLLIGGGIAAAVVIIGAGLFFSGILGGAKTASVTPPPNTTPTATPSATPAGPAMAHAGPAMGHGSMPTPGAEQPAPAQSATGGNSPNAASEKTLALRWMPPTTELVLHAKVAELWKAPLLKSLVDTEPVRKQIAEMKKYVGVEIQDIESVTIGMSGLESLQQQVAMSALGGAPKPPQMKGLLIGRTTKPLSQSAILQASPELKTQDHAGKTLITISPPPGSPAEGNDGGAWIIDTNTFAMGSLDELKTAMSTGETNSVRSELSFADSSHHVVIVVAPKDAKASPTTPAPQLPPGVPQQVASMQQAFQESGIGYSFGINVRGGIELQTSFLMKDSANLAKAKEGLDYLQGEGRKQFDAIKPTLQPLLAELGELLLSSLKIETTSNVVKVSAGVPDSAQEKIEQLPALLAVMAATSGFGPQLGNPFGGGPQGSPGNDTSLKNGLAGPAMANGNRPGETAAVSAVTAEGLSVGLKLTARAAWARAPGRTSDGKQVHPMELLIDLTGDELNGICAYGNASITTSTLAGGGSLSTLSVISDAGGDPLKTLIPFEINRPLNFDHPKGTVRLAIPVDPPATPNATTITAVEGKFRLLTSTKSKEFTVADAPKKALRPLMDPELKAAGVKLLLTKGNPGFPGEILMLSCAKGNFVGHTSAVPQSAFIIADVDKGVPVQKLMALAQDGKFPDTLQVKFQLYQDVQEQTVSFRFENIQLPSPNSKPQAPASLPVGAPQTPASPAPASGVQPTVPQNPPAQQPNSSSSSAPSANSSP